MAPSPNSNPQLAKSFGYSLDPLATFVWVGFEHLIPPRGLEVALVLADILHVAWTHCWRYFSALNVNWEHRLAKKWVLEGNLMSSTHVVVT